MAFFRRSVDDTTVIVGVVYPPGPGAGRLRGERDWTLRLELRPWRVHGETLRDAVLRVHRKVTDEQRRALQAEILPYMVVRARIKLAPDGRSAELVDLLERDAADSELRQQARALQQPVTRTDPLFGTLTFDRARDGWKGAAPWMGQAVRLYFSTDDRGEVAPALATARALWADQPGWDERVRAFAIGALLPLKNEAWLDEDEAELTPAAFAARMAVESISVDAEGGFDFFHKDGDMFLGHGIEVSSNLTHGPTRADIPG